MKILIVSRYFYPMITPRAFRTTELAKEFSRIGHSVTVITQTENLPFGFKKEFNLNVEDFAKLSWEVNLKGTVSNSILKRGFRRIMQLLFEYPNIEFSFKVKAALQQKIDNKENYDLLISIGAPHTIHWGVAAIWNKKNNLAKKWIADCGDPFMGQENETFKPFFYFQYIEKWFCGKVDFITLPVNSAIPAYYPEFHDKIRIIPQGFDFEAIPLAPYKKNEFPHFAYAGALIPGRRHPTEMLEFLVNYPHPYKFDIYADSEQMYLIRPYAERSRGRIEIKEFIPRKELLFELSKLEFVVNFENAGKRQIPSKTIDYVIVNKPILNVSSVDFQQKTLEEFLSGDYTNSLKIENPDQYRIETVANQFLQLASL